MNLFYTPDIEDEKIYHLNEIEAKHAIKVLRLQVNDEITLTNGKGKFYTALITKTDNKKCTLKITSTSTEKNTAPYIHIAIAPTKSSDRLEWFIEKTTEIGINEITPIVCAHAERKKLNEERLKKIAIAAMKQSLKAALPIVNPLTTLKNILTHPFEGKKYIAHCHKKNQKHLKNIYIKGENTLVLIGPEGDFSEEEIKLALQNGFEPITLSHHRLRTETAGIVACHTIQLLNE